jgi:hypothetical protein
MEVLLVVSVPIIGLYLVTDEHYMLLYCLRYLSDVVGLIFVVRVNDWFPTECLADCRFHCSWNNAVINPLKDCPYSCGFGGCMFVS